MDNTKTNNILSRLMTVSVIVASLGYFVDVYDLILFSIVRSASLKSMGYQGQQIMDYGVLLLNVQMVGMLLGGIIWGVLGDKKGRVKILFASILLYSIANIVNGFVQTIEGYTICRFIAGLGLAGELGVAVTLVLEILPKDIRGYGTMVVATIGVSGAVAANLVAKFFDWRSAYIIGGVLGTLLLVLQMKVSESAAFTHSQNTAVKKGNFFAFFTNKIRFYRYMKSIFIGLPIWFSLSVLITFSPEFAKALKINGVINAGDAVMYYYIGASIGDLVTGFLSQYLKSRKKILFYSITLLALMIAVYLIQYDISVSTFYIICFLTGLPAGYWAVFVTVSAEQFGTNLRATAASTIPNFVRGFVVPITLLFQMFVYMTNIKMSGAIVGGICLVIAFIALLRLEETYHKELDYEEE
jgi:putative MFS transporter